MEKDRYEMSRSRTPLSLIKLGRIVEEIIDSDGNMGLIFELQVSRKMPKALQIIEDDLEVPGTVLKKKSQRGKKLILIGDLDPRVVLDAFTYDSYPKG